MLERIGSFKLIFPLESRFVEFPGSKVIADDEEEEVEKEEEEEEEDEEEEEKGDEEEEEEEEDDKEEAEVLSNVEETVKEERGEGFEGGTEEGLSE